MAILASRQGRVGASLASRVARQAISFTVLEVTNYALTVRQRIGSE